MNTNIRLALYQPDIAANTGAIMRLCACLGAGLDIIEPCGFALDDRRLRRAGMDYMKHLSYIRHRSWDDFVAGTGTRRLVLLTTKGEISYHNFIFRGDDTLLAGQESAGVPFDIRRRVEACIVVPMQKPARSLNVGMSTAIVLAEAIKQTGGFL